MTVLGSNLGRRLVLCTVLVLGLAACATAPRESGINDPNEAANRRTHEMNKSVDKALLKPLSGSNSGSGQGPVAAGITNAAANLSLPGIVLNDLLQLNLEDAAHNTTRFVVNSTVGIAGLIDVAGTMGVPERSSDFGETLHVWGFPEGPYMELPFFGPSTARDTAGMVVDYVIDPLNLVTPRRYWYAPATIKLIKQLGNRGKYASLIDSIYYGSEDSYAQARLLYLQSRRQQLYGELDEEDLEDPYAE